MYLLLISNSLLNVRNLLKNDWRHVNSSEIETWINLKMDVCTLYLTPKTQYKSYRII